MGIMKSLQRIKLPKFKDILNINRTVRDETKKIDVNTIDVIFHTSNFKTSLKTTGIIDRTTSLPIVYISIPEDLGVFLLDDSIEINLDTGKQFIQVVENYPFSIILNSELSNEMKSSYYNDVANGRIKNINKENFKNTGVGYLIPILINKIPFNVIRINLEGEMNNNNNIEYATITQKMLTELGHVKLLQSTNEAKNDGMVIIAIVFGLMGAFIGAMITMYILGSK